MARAGKPFTGWHATATFVAFFGVVVAVNVTMASYARSTMGGIVVENSYVASQHYNDWLERAEASKKLGWKPHMAWLPNGRLSVELEGAPAGTELIAQARHPLGRTPDKPLSFAAQADGRFLSRESLPDGRWYVRFQAQAGDDVWRAEEELK